MNEEEKKAIEKFKFCGGNFVLDKESSKVVLNLIDKLQKENDELKKFITEGITIEPNSSYKNYQLNFLRENFISKQKIKDKIGDLADLANKINNEIVEELKSNAICQEYLEDKRKELRLINRDIKTLQSLLEESEDSKDGEG